MKLKGKNIFRWMVWTLGLAALAGPYFPTASAFTFFQKISVGASASTSGSVSPGSLVIISSPLQGYSQVSKLIIIQGSAGKNPTNAPQSFASRLTPASSKVKTSAADNSLRVTVQYRFISPAADPTSVQFNTLGVVQGPDPMSFAFQVNSQEVIEGMSLDYRIIAEKLDSAGNVLYRATVPSAAKDGRDYYEVNSAAQAPIVLGMEGGRVSFYQGNPNVGNPTVEVPAGILSAKTTLSLVDVPLDADHIPGFGKLVSPVVAYRVDISPALQAQLKFSLGYPDFIFPQGQQGLLGNTGLPESSALVMGWDGFNWLKLGGTIDPNSNLIRVFSQPYQYLVIAPGSLSAEDTIPTHKVIAPYGDLNNRVLVFQGLTSDVQVDIYDSNGHRIRTCQLQWDARDDSGKIVESGVYIYQYKFEGKRISGVVAVVK